MKNAVAGPRVHLECDEAEGRRWTDCTLVEQEEAGLLEMQGQLNLRSKVDKLPRRHSCSFSPAAQYHGNIDTDFQIDNGR